MVHGLTLMIRMSDWFRSVTSSIGAEMILFSDEQASYSVELSWLSGQLAGSRLSLGLVCKSLGHFPQLCSVLYHQWGLLRLPGLGGYSYFGYFFRSLRMWTFASRASAVKRAHNGFKLCGSCFQVAGGARHGLHTMSQTHRAR